MEDKTALRRRLRRARREHVAQLPERIRALMFVRPPRAVAETVASATTIGVYAETPEEAPASGYARWFFDRGHALALPWFEARGEPMGFRLWRDPYTEALESGPWGMLQPSADAPLAEPEVTFVPLVGFTPGLGRLGMGAGHYDRWLAEHPGVRAVGLAWDCQEAADLPLEPHDRPLGAVITPTRLFGPFDQATPR